jgi:hypothetical protein
MAQSASTGEAKAALRAAIGRDAVQLSPEQISTQNLPAAAAARKPRDITISDHDPDDRPIVISV